MNSSPTLVEQPVRPDRTTSVIWLFGALVLIVTSLLLKAGDGRQVVVRGLDVALPESCASYRLLGINCPGCGLTRTFVAVSDGRLGDAMNLNPVGVVGYFFVLVQIPLAAIHFLMLTRGMQSKAFSKLISWNQWAFFAVLLGLVCQWIVRSID